MNAKTTSRKGSWIQVNEQRAARGGMLLLLLLLTLPAVVQAQFTYTINNGTVTITGYTGPGGDVAIPSTLGGYPVTTIGGIAFLCCNNLTSITIPNSVTSIGDYAFETCTGLANITIPDSVTWIGVGAFYQCTALTSVTIPNSVTSIGQNAFEYCTRLTGVTIPTSVTSIASYTFEYCSSLTNITMPNSITSIGSLSFEYCTNLTAVYFRGKAPTPFSNPFLGDNKATVYYLPGSLGWGSTFGGRPTALWRPQVQTGGGNIGVRTNQFGFNINWASGQIIVVEACTNLANPIWSPVWTNTLTGDSSYFSDPQWTNYSARFYHLRSP